jgi:stage II sporulation SpoE-like protein
MRAGRAKRVAIRRTERRGAAIFGLLLYTDGLPEARPARRDGQRELFGEQAARDALRRLRRASLQEIVTGLRSAVVAHAQGAPADDLCLVAIRRDPREPAQRQAA